MQSQRGSGSLWLSQLGLHSHYYSTAKDTRESDILHQGSSTIDHKNYWEMMPYDSSIAPELSIGTATSIRQDSLVGKFEEAKK